VADAVDLRPIAEILGQWQITLTANLYTQVMPAATQQIADCVDALLSGAPWPVYDTRSYSRSRKEPPATRQRLLLICECG
jgi:hypothetical protein